MSPSLSRRELLQGAALAGIGYWTGARPALAHPNSPAEKVRVACIGVGGRGAANVRGVASAGAELVAFADVDDARAGGTYKKYPQVRRFRDYRKMFDKLRDDIDAVVVSTPDHTHFHPSMVAMNLGKHLYCEKPMAHNLYEVRTMTDRARDAKLVTQLGVQRHTIPNVHRVVELVRSGAIGDVTDVHAWVGSSRGMPKLPEGKKKAPDHLDYDLWIGPAPFRPYAEYGDGKGVLAPYNWRFWWDYGTGETGNWGCHILDIPFWALELDYPTRVSASGPELDPDRTPRSMDSTMEFPARGKRKAVKLHWGQRSKGPDVLEEYGAKKRGSGVFFIGTKGALLCDFNSRQLLPEKDFQDFQAPEPSLPKSPGFYREWVDGIRGADTPPTCRFDYSGPMAETVLLANVAYRAGESFEWNAEKLTASSEKAQAFIREDYRKGWEIT